MAKSKKNNVIEEALIAKGARATLPVTTFQP